jgi:hypothetical protein
MDIDDPRLEEARVKMNERYQRYTDRIVEVLKGHISLEQALDELLRVARRRRKRPFAGKIDICEKLFCPELNAELWGVVKAGNELRNAVAHGKPQGTIDQRVADLKGALLA